MSLSTFAAFCSRSGSTVLAVRSGDFAPDTGARGLFGVGSTCPASVSGCRLMMALLGVSMYAGCRWASWV